METFNVGDRVIFYPVGEEDVKLKATVTEQLDFTDEHPYGGLYSIRLDEPFHGWTETAAHGIDLTKTGYVSLDTLLADD